MSKIPDIEFGNEIFNMDSGFSGANLDDSDAYLYEKMIKNLNTNEKKGKIKRKVDYEKGEYFENYNFKKKKSKKPINLKKNIEKIKRNISKEERIKKKGLRHQKTRFSIGSGIIPKSLLFGKKSRLKKKIYNFKTENNIETNIKRKKNEKNFLKTEELIKNSKNIQKEKLENKLKFLSEKIVTEKKYKSRNEKIESKKLKSKRESYIKNKKNVINQNEVWKYVENLSKTSLSDFIRKVNIFHNNKFGKNKHFLTGSTFDNKSDLSLNTKNKMFFEENNKNENKNDIEDIKRDLDEVKAYISSFKKKQNKNHILEKIKNLADL